MASLRKAAKHLLVQNELNALLDLFPVGLVSYVDRQKLEWIVQGIRIGSFDVSFLNIGDGPLGEKVFVNSDRNQTSHR